LVGRVKEAVEKSSKKGNKKEVDNKSYKKRNNIKYKIITGIVDY
jgi:hypothetical protein